MIKKNAGTIKKVIKDKNYRYIGVLLQRGNTLLLIFNVYSPATSKLSTKEKFFKTLRNVIIEEKHKIELELKAPVLIIMGGRQR